MPKGLALCVKGRHSHDEDTTAHNHFFVFYCYMFAAAIGCCSAASCQVGIALKPATPAELVLPYLQQGLLDLVSNT